MTESKKDTATSSGSGSGSGLTARVGRAKMDEETQQAVLSENAEAMREINERIQGILDQAPSDASVELSVRKSAEGYKGMFKIYSRQRKFVSGHSGKRFSEVLDHIFDEVRAQIDEWKRHRHFEDATDIL